MSQISPPIRILLIAVIGLCAAYMLFLRPKEEAVPATPAAATTPVPAKDPNAKANSKPGSAVNQAVRGADNAAARADEAAGGAISETEGGAVPATTSPATQTTATGETAAPAALTKEALRRLPKDVRSAVRQHKVLVLLFYNNRSEDDRAVRRELSNVKRYGDQVFVDAHWIKSVGRYQAITRGVAVEQSPTIIVADRNLKAETLVGYVDSKTIDQTVVDAILASGGSLITDPYFRALESICVAADNQVTAVPVPTSAAAVPAYFAVLHQASASTDKKAGAVKTPKKHKRFASKFNYLNSSTTGLYLWATNYTKAHPREALSVLRSTQSSAKKDKKEFIAKHGAHGLSCF